MREGDGVVADVTPAHARRIGGADQRADRGAGDRGGFYPHLVQRFDHRDVGEPAGAAAAEREREGFFHAPACSANSHALAASGRTISAFAAANALVAVPSRTRPTMPCRIAARRKKL